VPQFALLPRPNKRIQTTPPPGAGSRSAGPRDDDTVGAVDRRRRPPRQGGDLWLEPDGPAAARAGRGVDGTKTCTKFRCVLWPFQRIRASGIHCKLRTDNASLTVFRQRIADCPALLNRQRIVEIGVGPGSFSWDAGSSRCPCHRFLDGQLRAAATPGRP